MVTGVKGGGWMSADGGDGGERGDDGDGGEGRRVDVS